MKSITRRRKKGEGSIRKKGNGWEARITVFYDDRVQTFSYYNKEQILVVDWLNNKKLEIKQESSLEKSNYTISSWIIEWLNACKSNYIRANTFSSYIRLFKNHIKPALGDIKISDLNKSKIQLFINDLYKSGLSPKTVKEVYNVLNGALEEALDRDYIYKNVAKKIKLPARNKPEKKILTAEEENEWIELLRKEKLGITIEFLLLTGLRCEELCGLKWKNIDLKNRLISIEKSFQDTELYDKELNLIGRERKINELKTKNSKRKVPIQDRLYNDFLKYSKESEHKAEDFVFLSTKGNPLITNNIEGRLKRFIKRHDLKKIGPHSLRHTFATRCLEAGINAKTLQDLLGHSDYSTTANNYLHVTQENKINSMNKLTEYMKQFEEKEISNGKNSGKI